MTDVHTHFLRAGAEEWLTEPCNGEARFIGCHPWSFLDGGVSPSGDWLEAMRERLLADESLGVGEIGLDRLKVREIPDAMRAAFIAQLQLAAELHRPVVLHGSKCWGQIVKACEAVIAKYGRGSIPAFLFHGFSRSGGLLPQIVALNGYVSVGAAVLNDHAVNYRKLVESLPSERLLLETDCTADSAAPSIGEIAVEVARLRGISLEEIETLVDANAARFMSTAFH